MALTRITCAALTVAALLGSAHASPPRDLGKLGVSLAELRAQIDGLSSALQSAKEGKRSEERTLKTRLQELELDLSRERLRLKQLREQAAKRDGEAKAAKDANAALKPAILGAIETIRAGVALTIPFHLEARLKELDKLKQRLESGALTAPRSLAQLWAQVDDELRLSQGSAVDQQEIEVDGAKVLAKIARVGTAMLFFTTPDGATGYATRAKDGWAWKKASTPEDVQRIRALFDAFQKGIRAGWFELPWALLGVKS